MAKDIGKLAVIGEKHLLISLGACMGNVWLAFQPPVNPADRLNSVFNDYKSKRAEAIACGLDIKRYDEKVRKLIKNHPEYSLN